MNQLPPNFQPLAPTERFRFACHPGVPCFTECCRDLDLELTPYDVLRLKNALDMHSGNFLEQYVIIEWEEGQPFPHCYLTMVDDGRASCVFVAKSGCTVYGDRPGACRAYPVGRGASQNLDGTVREHHVLVKEPHCRGFLQDQSFTVDEYFRDQELERYNRLNDQVLRLLKHPQIRAGYRPDKDRLDQYILALYNPDMLRQEFADGRISLARPLTAAELQGLAGDDEELLLLGIRWLLESWFQDTAG